MKKLGQVFLIALFFCLVFLYCMPALADTDILMNTRITVPGDGQTYRYTFSPTSNNLYSFRSFGGTGQAALYLDGESIPIAQSDGFSFEARLIADATYHLQITCNEETDVEIMRKTLGRCVDQPILLRDPSQGYDKAIARAYDTHWYSFTAPVSGAYVIRSASEINTVGYLLDASGQRLFISDNLYSPYCMDFRMEPILEAGKTYIIRVSGRGSETGSYHLSIAVPKENQQTPQSAVLNHESLSMEEGQSVRLKYRVQPEDSIRDAVWISADPSVATVDAAGHVHAVGAGETRIILSAAGGVECVCPVTVAPVHVTDLTLKWKKYTLCVGETLILPASVTPENASDPVILYESSDQTVAVVDSKGEISALSPGQTTLTLMTRDGGYTKTVSLTVNPAKPKYRVLVLGVQRFPDGDYRMGAVNTAQGIYDLFSRQKYESGAPEVSIKLDPTRTEAVSAIRNAFAQAQPTDVSVLCINSHGGLTGRNAWIKFANGQSLTAVQLEQVLRTIPGKVALIVDCCQSGAFISSKAERSFGARFTQAFRSDAASSMRSSKYSILTSSSSRQNSYRLLPARDASESNSSTAFSRSLCEAGGWNLIDKSALRMRADMDRSQSVTLQEAFLYCQRQVIWYLGGNPGAQDVQVYPSGSQLILFRRESDAK